MEKVYRVQMNSKGMPNFSTAVEIEDIPIYGNEHNCMMTIFGTCSYAETGCGDCAVVEKVRKALSADRPSAVDLSSVYSTAYKSGYKKGKADRPQGEWICHKGKWIDFDYYPTKYECDQCHHYVDVASDKNFCPNCGADMRERKEGER